MEIYSHDSYESFLSDWATHFGGRGGKSALAKAAGCSPSWMTKVLAREVHLSQDQAYGIALTLGMNENETEYFLLLVDLGRASSQALRKRLQVKIAAIQRAARNLGKSIRVVDEVPEAEIARYYSSWLYSAVHVFCMVRPRGADEAAQYFRVKRTIVESTLRHLRDMGLVKSKEGLWFATEKALHLSNGAWVSANHVHWRSRTMQHLQDNDTGGFHYSAVHCLSEKDFEVVRKKMKEAILSCLKVTEPSPSETLGVLCADWYSF